MGGRNRALHSFVYFAMDAVLAYVGVLCSIMWSPYYTIDDVAHPWRSTDIGIFAILMPLAISGGLNIVGMQRDERSFEKSRAIIRTIEGISLGLIFLLSLGFLVYYSVIGRRIILVASGYCTCFIIASRLFVWKAVATTKSGVIAGLDSCADLSRKIVAHRLPMTTVRLENLEWCREATIRGGVVEIAGESLDEIIVDDSENLAPPLREFLMEATASGVGVLTISLVHEQRLQQAYVRGLNDNWFWGYDPAYNHPAMIQVKRLSDMALAMFVGLFSLPILTLSALAIWLDDRGPIFYSQVRIGAKNRPFTIYKLRSMRLDAENDGPRWASLKDSRVTRIGSFLRKTRIDELPQIWNITKGDMSFVGPRPERPEFVDQIENVIKYYRYRHLVKPGLTGWAQINYPYGSSIDDAREKLAYDLYYVKNLSIAMDSVIVMRTIFAVMRGAR